MDENENIQAIAVEETDDMMPVGYADGDDFFDMASWTGDTGDGGADQQPAAAEDFSLEEFLTNGTEANGENIEDNPAAATTTGAPAATPSPEKLRFQATFDHNTEDVELDPSELPTIYQKARATERAQGRLNEVKPVYDRMEATARMLGYASVSDMLDATEKATRILKSQDSRLRECTPILPLILLNADPQARLPYPVKNLCRKFSSRYRLRQIRGIFPQR